MTTEELRDLRDFIHWAARQAKTDRQYVRGEYLRKAIERDIDLRTAQQSGVFRIRLTEMMRDEANQLPETKAEPLRKWASVIDEMEEIK
jgi:hypothetical protein